MTSSRDSKISRLAAAPAAPEAAVEYTPAFRSSAADPDTRLVPARSRSTLDDDRVSPVQPVPDCRNRPNVAASARTLAACTAARSRITARAPWDPAAGMIAATLTRPTAKIPIEIKTSRTVIPRRIDGVV